MHYQSLSKHKAPLSQRFMIGRTASQRGGIYQMYDPHLKNKGQQQYVESDENKD